MLEIIKNCVRIYNGLMTIVTVVHGLPVIVIVAVNMYVFVKLYIEDVFDDLKV